MRWAIAAVLCFMATASVAAPLYNKPVYDPATKSYFELYFPDPEAQPDSVQSFTWDQAVETAKEQWFKSVRGRLAVVKTRATNNFLLKTFRPDHNAWIGLRYRCDARVLQWVTGEIWPLTSYANWGPAWNVAGGSPFGKERATCGGGSFGVHYWSQMGGFRWNANVSQARFVTMFIEFPTGEP